jgi:hypothetical protein
MCAHDSAVQTCMYTCTNTDAQIHMHPLVHLLLASVYIYIYIYIYMTHRQKYQICGVLSRKLYL